MNYTHLTIEERCCLREYYNQGYSYRKIGELLGRSASTICREVNRNRSFMNVKPAYYPHTAQKKYLLRRSYCHRGMFQDPTKLDYIKARLLETFLCGSTIVAADISSVLYADNMPALRS